MGGASVRAKLFDYAMSAPNGLTMQGSVAVYGVSSLSV